MTSRYGPRNHSLQDGCSDRYQCSLSAASVGYSTLKDRQKEVLVNASQDFNTFCLVSFYYTRHIALAS